MTTLAQFNSKLGYPVKATDARYTIDFPLIGVGPTAHVDGAVNRFSWLSAFGTLPTDLIVGATFNGTTAYVIANSAAFETEILAAGGVKVV
jgi:hypothetical protein